MFLDRARCARSVVLRAVSRGAGPLNPPKRTCFIPAPHSVFSCRRPVVSAVNPRRQRAFPLTQAFSQTLKMLKYDSIKAADDEFVLHTYNRMPALFVQGAGCSLWD